MATSTTATVRTTKRPEPVCAAPQGAKRPWRLAYLLSHPIQYQAPLLRYLAARPELQLEVFYQSDFSAGLYSDHGFGRPLCWDTDLLGGYRHQFLPALGSRSRCDFLRPLSHGFADALRRGNFDALWVHGYAHQQTLRALLGARALDLPVLLRGESRVQGQGGSRLRAYARTSLLRRLFARIDGALAIGTENHAFYCAHGMPPERIFSMPYAVDNAHFRERALLADASQDQLRAQLGLEPERPVLLFAGKLIERKRPGDLLAAYARLVRGLRRPPYLLFVGDGPLSGDLERQVHSLGLEGVRFLGFRNQSELPALYRLCDLLVLPSEYETWGLVLNEVMNASRALIASEAVGAAADLVRPGVTGWSYPAGDVTALAQRLEQALADPERLQSMGEQAYEHVQSFDFRTDWRGLSHALATVAPR